MEDGIYGAIGAVLGAMVGFIVFVGSWIYCIATYGYLLGVGLGWLPSIIVAAITFFLVKWLWGLVCVGVFIYAESTALDRGRSVYSICI